MRHYKHTTAVRLSKPLTLSQALAWLATRPITPAAAELVTAPASVAILSWRLGVPA